MFFFLPALLESLNPQRPDEADYFFYSSLHLNILISSLNGLEFSAEVIRAPIMVLTFKLNVIAAVSVVLVQ